MSFAETENLIARYDAATTALDQAVTDRLSASIDASFRNLIKELERQYPIWQSEGSLYASQRRLLLVQELGGLLDVIKPEDAAQYQALLQEALQISHTTGATLADELTRTIDPGYPLADFVTIPIEAAALQAREGVKRLYRYNEDFRTAASGIVEQGLIQGWGTKRVQAVMERELGVTKSKAETLARTEVMSALNGAAQQRYQDNGISWVMWQVAPSDRLCPVCAARDGNVYEVGQISLPAHPRGRCILVPMRREWIEKDLIDSAAIAKSRDKTQAEFIAGGGKLDNGPTAWERKAGLTSAPTPVWKAGDAPLQPVAKAAEPKPKRTRKPKATPAPLASEAAPTLKGDRTWNPSAKPDLTPAEFRRYVDDQYWLKNQSNPTAAHNLSWEEYKAANPRARKPEYQRAVKDAMRLNQFVPRESALTGLKLSKDEQAQLENNRIGIEQRNARIADMDRAVKAPLMPDSTRGWKPQMTPAEAAEYLDGSYFGNTRFYHGNRASITDDIANDGAKPWLNDKGIYGQGTYFGIDPKIGDLYAKTASQNGNVEVGLVTSHIKARNPYVVTSAQLDELGASFPGSQSNGTDSASMTAFLKARGYDSVYLTDLGYGVAFDQRQVVVVSNERLTPERLDGIVVDPSLSAKDMVSPENQSAATLRSVRTNPIQGDPPEDEWMGLGDLANYNPGSEDDWEDY